MMATVKFRFSQNVPMFPSHSQLGHVHYHRRFFSWYAKQFQTTSQARASVSGGSSNSQGNAFLVPGATVATLLMLGVLHARRLYDDKKVEEAREKGIEFEFRPDVKATFLRMLPLRSISRVWGFLTNLEVPVWLRPHVYRAWARAYHSNLEEAALPLEEYASLRDFFVRTLREGCRPIDPDPYSLVSPVDGTILRFGELEDAGAMIEQVKGFSYSVTSLLGSHSLLSMIAEKNTQHKSSNIEQESTQREKSKKSWWWISLASPKVRETVSECVIDDMIVCAANVAGRLFPLNERATRTIRSLYVENERVVLEGLWQQGFMAIAAIGATNIGSIELFIEPELRTNRPRKKLLPTEPPEDRVYEPEGVGVMLKKGDGLAAFNMGSTVVLVFQAPTSKSPKNTDASKFRFSIRRGDRIRVGQALGRWHDS
ncbi:phosphatidylserine decarboxylase proenzyme 1, mitochondrial-like isoform X2 [Durio zibethinus]|uniref:phosphatidylserine decarboxylase n=1 Tax=Durio zibethinus TaxID=66656 RepID=A0A6P5Y9I9_DURZI|nr:phosphatidylserine decarboxylase proenzyme 1, mitochondrial-like isoform X2 [Durio zibethinus]